MQRAPRYRRRNALTTAPRPNELSDMGRINALAEPIVALGPGSSVSGPRPVAAAPERVSPRIPLLVGGAVFWFVIATVAELAGGDPSVEAPLFLVALAMTCLAGAMVGRSWGDDIALAVGSIAGLVLSSLLVATEPAGHAAGDIVTVAIYIGVAVAVLSPVFRRLMEMLGRT